MTTLVLALHHAADAVSALDVAVANRGDVEVRGKVINGLSSAYHAYAAHLHSGGRILPALAKDLGAEHGIADYDRVLLVTWSAPYALAEDLLAIEEDADALTGWIALDSGYGHPTPGIVELAKKAAAGEKLYYASYTDIETKPDYPSSADFLVEVQKRAGATAPVGLFDVQHLAHNAGAYKAAHDKGAFWRGEHISALHRGPERLAAALDALDAAAGGQAS